jgi:hypothetical protein
MAATSQLATWNLPAQGMLIHVPDGWPAALSIVSKCSKMRWIGV